LEGKKMVKAIVLCGGYATRLYPLTENQAKPLLEIGGKSLLDYIVDKINDISEVDEIIIISNHKFIEDFILWKEDYGDSRINILDDGSTDNENRLGALRDLEFALDSCDVKDDFLVLAGDNLIEFSMREFYQVFKELGKNLIGVYDVRDIEKVRGKHGVAVLDGDRVIGFQEKPPEPKSTIKSFFCYLFKPEVKGLLGEYLKGCSEISPTHPTLSGNSTKFRNSDAPGYFIEWLCKRADVYAYDVGLGNIFDIGSLEGLESVRERFKGRE